MTATTSTLSRTTSRLSPPSDESGEDYTEETQEDAHAAPSPASEVKEQEPEDVAGEEVGHQNAEERFRRHTVKRHQ